jgi:predicted ATPase
VDGRSGCLYLEGASGDVEPVSAMQLGVLLNRSGLRLVVLDACASGRLATDALRSLAPALIRAQVPAVVALQVTAPEEATCAFAGEFYRALAEGFPIDACVTEGRKAVMSAAGLRRPDWGIPVIYTRAPDDRLFERPAERAHGATPVAPAALAPATPETAQMPQLQPAPPQAEPEAAPIQRELPEQRISNLPTELTALVGRNQDVEAASTLILRPDVRLLTLTGTAGTGKTRLAIQIATNLLDSFAHGVWFVNLAPVGQRDLVLTTIAHTLGLTETGDQPLLDRLKEHLRDRQLLLVLDNFEQVLAAAPLLADLLAAAARLEIQVTSRAALRISGEYEFPVAPLALPDLRNLPPVATLAQKAIALFAERARAVRPSFALDDGNAQTVAEICARLDGLPLAIELAAARCNVLSTAALLARLTKRLDVLTGGARDLAARQQTLRGAITWSYDLLDENECRLFARLGVFVGGATLEAIEAVAAELKIENEQLKNGLHSEELSILNSQFSILDGLASLVDKSLLRQLDDTAGEPRFVMLETIREYAQERLVASGEAALMRRLHADYLLAFVEQAEPELTGPQQAVWLERLEREHDNLRAALGWAAEQGVAATAGRLSGALWRFWYIRGHLSEGRHWLALALNLAAPDAIRAKMLTGAGGLAWAQGDHAQARACYSDALALFRALGDRSGIARILNNLGVVAEFLEDYPQMQTCYAESLALYQELGDRIGIARALNNMGLASVHQAEYPQAQRYYAEALALLRELGDQRTSAIVLHNLGEVALRQQDYTQAQYHYLESLALRRGLGDKEGIAFCLEGLAAVVTAWEQPLRAARLWGAAEALRTMIGAPLPSIERSAYDRTVAAGQNQAQAAAWAAAWAAGRDLALEQALDEAAAISQDGADVGTSGKRPTAPMTAPSAVPIIARLLLATQDGPRVILIERAPLIIGRDSANQIILDDARVSRRHAQLSYRLERFWLVDLESTNGTYVNSEQIGAQALSDGDTISLGGLELTFKSEA